jgi:hypothetical protein
MRTRVWLLAAVPIAVALLGCGSSTPTTPSTAASPTPVSPPTPSPFPDINGNWTGTFQSTNLPARTIAVTIVQQSGFCIDGAWKDASSQWTGAISGIATSESFSGQMSFERTADGGGKCTAYANVEGPIDAGSIHWKAGAFTMYGSCDGDLPQSVIVTLQRP